MPETRQGARSDKRFSDAKPLPFQAAFGRFSADCACPESGSMLESRASGPEGPFAVNAGHCTRFPSGRKADFSARPYGRAPGTQTETFSFPISPKAPESAALSALRLGASAWNVS